MVHGCPLRLVLPGASLLCACPRCTKCCRVQPCVLGNHGPDCLYRGLLVWHAGKVSTVGQNKWPAAPLCAVVNLISPVTEVAAEMQPQNADC